MTVKILKKSVTNTPLGLGMEGMMSGIVVRTVCLHWCIVEFNFTMLVIRSTGLSFSTIYMLFSITSDCRSGFVITGVFQMTSLQRMAYFTLSLFPIVKER